MSEKDNGFLVPVEGGNACIKCHARSGDGWTQCGGVCPIPGTPHYVPGIVPKLKAIEHHGQQIHLLQVEILRMRQAELDKRKKTP